MARGNLIPLRRFVGVGMTNEIKKFETEILFAIN
jgi:hypothetical protein